MANYNRSSYGSSGQGSSYAPDQSQQGNNPDAPEQTHDPQHDQAAYGCSQNTQAGPQEPLPPMRLPEQDQSYQGSYDFQPPAIQPIKYGQDGYRLIAPRPPTFPSEITGAAAASGSDPSQSNRGRKLEDRYNEEPEDDAVQGTEPGGVPYTFPQLQRPGSSVAISDEWRAANALPHSSHTSRNSYTCRFCRERGLTCDREGPTSYHSCTSCWTNNVLCDQ